MNKNPERPEDIDKIVSKCINPETKEGVGNHNDREEEIKSMVFGE